MSSEFTSMDQTTDTRASGLLNDVEQPPQSPSNETKANRFKTYLRSQMFLEVVACVFFYFLCCVLYVIKLPGNQRPIPYQLLENSGEYVRNLVNNESTDGSTVSVPNLYLLAVIVPFLFQVLASEMFGKLGDTHAAICVNLVAHGTTHLATESLKLYVGYLRPVFYQYCVPGDDYQECTGTSSEVADVRKSFPSGHASTAFCGLTILSLYLHNRFGVPSVRALQKLPVDEATNTMRWKVVYLVKTPFYYRCISFFSMAPLALALFIAASRVVDNKHFPADVIGGAILGASISRFVNGLWYEY
jgi:membrane-associated phospholipid phosphatase